MAKWLTIAAAIVVAGCATNVPPEAQNVVLHEETSSSLKDCKRLGPVSTEVSLWKMPTIDAGHVQAKDNLRAEAYRQHGADTVVLVNLDTYITKVEARGVALKCNE
jgi:hypothetical protein